MRLGWFHLRVRSISIFRSSSILQPVLFVMEDLHWVDPTTLEFLNLLVNQAPILCRTRAMAVGFPGPGIATERRSAKPGPGCGYARQTSVCPPRICGDAP